MSDFTTGTSQKSVKRQPGINATSDQKRVTEGVVQIKDLCDAL